MPVPARYRALVIGCGRIGTDRTPPDGPVTSHAHAYRQHPRTELVALADDDAAVLRTAERTWRVSVATDPAAIARRSAPDIVSICTPDQTHFAIATRLLDEAPPRCLVIEKPMAMTSAEAREIESRATRAGTLICVNHSRRFSPAFGAVRSELAAGEHGSVVLARCVYTKGILHNGVHAIDLLRWWLGEPVRARGRSVADGDQNDPVFDADLWFGNGARAHLDGFDHRVASIFEMDLLAERSRIRFWDGGARWEFSRAVDSSLFSGHRAFEPTYRERSDPLFFDPMASCLIEAVGDIVASLDGGPPPRCTAQDGIAAVEWAERIRTSG